MKTDAESDWRQLAACRHADPTLFFPGKEDRDTQNLAVLICRECPVIEACLEAGKREPHGVWGGQFRNREGYRSPMNPHDSPCGTERGWQRHHRQKSRPCLACLDAHERHVGAVIR